MNLHDHIDALQSILVDIIPDPDERLHLAVITAGTQQLIDKLDAVQQQAQELLKLLRTVDRGNAPLFYCDELAIELDFIRDSPADFDLESCLVPLDSHMLLQENAA